MKIDTVVSGIKNLVNNEWLRRTGKALLYALHVVVHPFDGFWDLKNEKRGTASAATIIVILVLMTRLLSLQFTSFQFMEVNWEKINIWMEMAQILLPLTIWVVANWCLTTLFDGKGSMTEVYIATAYALAPYVLIQIPLFMRQRRSVTGLLFVMPFVIGLLLFILRPMITSIQMSFSKVNLNGAAGGFSMEFVGWANFLQALTIDKDFNRLLTESVRDTLIDGVCIIIFSLIIAVILNRKFPGRGAVRAIFFMPVILASGVVLGMEKSNMLLQGIQDLQSASTNTTITTTVQELLLGALGNTASDLIQLIMNIINHFYDIVVASSIQTVIFLSALQTINPSIYEAAEMEGCGAWEKLWKITIPLLSPMILVNWIYTIIDRFIRADNQLMTKILDCITETLDYGFSSAMAWIYCLCMVKGDFTEEVMEVMAWLGLEGLEAVPYENYLQR